jgi:outer membrane protein TolC
MQIAAARTITVGIVTDGPTERPLISPANLKRAGESVLAGSDLTIAWPADKQLAGGWSVGGVRQALDHLLADEQVDVVIALGIVASNEAARHATLAKPVIAPVVPDPLLQNFPLQDGRSGRHNFTYVTTFNGIEDEVRRFASIVPFKHLAAIVDELTLEAAPTVRAKADALAAELGVSIALVPATDSIDAILARLPADTDAVYVTSIPRLTDAEFAELARRLTERRLPTLSRVGHHDVELGILFATSGNPADYERLARRLVLEIQRIAAGEDPAGFDVGFPADVRLAINMRTARAIGFSPRWADLTDAVLYFAEEPGSIESLSLLDAMHAALAESPTLQASAAGAEVAADQVRDARSNLLPQLNAAATATRIDADRASPLLQAERTSSAALELKQLVYSERAWAGYAISRKLRDAADEQHRQTLLDTLRSTADAYLNLLRAKSVEAVRRDYVENTRKNLETARIREAVGLSQHSDYLRWVAQLASDRQNLLGAESQRRQAEAEVARLIHRPTGKPFATVESGLNEPMAFVSDARTQAYIATPAKWLVFQEYSVASALEHAPELRAIDAEIAAQQRSVKSAQRAYFLPDIALQAQGSDLIDESGAGSQLVPGAPNDDSWNVSLQASLPLFTGGARGAAYAEARHKLRQFNAQRAATADAIEARTRAALYSTASSYPSIDLSHEAAQAARQNLAMVADAYAKGVVSVTDLTDAQNAALNAQLGEAEAKYTFLIDFIEVLRTSGSYDILLDPASRAAWYDRIDAWFRDHGALPAKE